MRYNLHTHTKRCNHAQGEDREYVEAAIKAGIKTLGFPTTVRSSSPAPIITAIFGCAPRYLTATSAA